MRKNKNKILIVSIFFLTSILLAISVGFSKAQVSPQMNVSAFVSNEKDESLKNGEYDVRFALYRTDRKSTDPYPSDSDASQRVWQETQKVTITGGVLDAYLGSSTPLPAGLNFFSNDYYLGIRINSDSEFVPRKKLGAAPFAMDSAALGGATVGTAEGNILQLGAKGKIDIKMMPTGTGSNQVVLGNDSRFKNISDIHLQNTDTGTTELVFNVGSDSALSGNNFDIAAGSAASKPALRFNGNANQWQYSNDGATFTTMGTVGNIDASQITTGILGAQFGGTGINIYSVGDMLYANSATTLAKLAIGSNGQVMTIVGGSPVWADVSGASPLNHDLLSSQHSDATAATVLQGALITGQGSSATWSLLGPGASGQILGANGIGANLGWITLTKSDISLGNVENTALSTWNGSANITTLGTITGASALWHGSVVGATYGGTGLSTYALGDILYASSTSALSRLSMGTAGQALIVSAGGLPTWSSSVPTYPHNLLSSAEHPDTTTGTATRGDLIVGNVSNLWSRLAVGTAGNNILTNNGTDVAWNSTAAMGLATLSGSETFTNKTIGAGSSWQGNSVITTYGGTGISGGYAAGDTLYFSVGNSLTRLARGANGTILSLSGGFPAWIATTGITTLGTITTGTWNGTIIDIAHGGTGSGTAAGARTALGMGTLATANSINNSNWSGAPLAVANGGTGSTDGSITGTGALTFAAGGLGNGINLNPSGTGMVNVNGALAIKAGGYETVFYGNGSQVSSIVYYLPPADGTADGQVLKTDSFGNLRWEDVTGGSGGAGTVTSVSSGNGLATGTGTPITNSGYLYINLLSANAGNASTSSFSGLQFSGAFNNQLALLQGCANNEVLAWNNTAKTWGCSTVSGVGGITGSGTTGYVTYWNGTSSLVAEQYLSVSRGGTGSGTTVGARTNLGLSIGLDIQAYNASLAAIAAGTWTGATSITTLSTITSGTWNGNTISPIFGGTGLNSYTGGDILYADGVNSLATLAAGAGNIGNVLVVNGSGMPAWSASAPTYPHNFLSTSEHPDTTTGVVVRGDIITGQGATASWSRLARGAAGDILTNNGVDVVWNSTASLNLATLTGTETLTNKTMGAGSGWQGNSITTSYGGTGLTSYTQGDILYYNAGVSLSKLARGSDGMILSLAGGVPAWSSTAPGAAHPLLSSSHSDTTAAAVSQGAIITGRNASTTWSLLGPGTSGQVLRANGAGADLGWVTLTKSDIALGNVENTALSTWNGSANVTTLGTITSGTWNGAAIANGNITAAFTGKTYNGLTITANGTNTLNIAAGQTLTVTNGGTLGTAAYTASSSYAPAFSSTTQNFFWATPNGSAGMPTMRAIAVADIPTLNQNTTGNAATATNLTGMTATVANLNTVNAALGTAAFTASTTYATSAQGTLATNALPTASFSDGAVTGKVLTGYVSGAGVVAATDTILQAINKLNANDATNANLTGEVTSVGNATTVTNSAVIGKVLTGFVSGAGTVAATDTVLQAIQKLSGNIGASGTVTSVSVATANGISGTVANATSTPAITLTLGNIVPTTVNGLTITANGTNTLNIAAGQTLTVTNGGTLGTAAYTASSSYAPAFSSTTQNFFWATPNGSAGMPTMRAIAVADIPTLNQNTTGNAATATNLTGMTATVANLNTVNAALGTAAFTASTAYATSAQGTLATNALPTASFTDGAVTGKVLTGYVSGAGVVAATDTILQAINKLNGNISALGSLAALNSINNSNWSGAQLAVTNGGTGTTTQLTAGSLIFAGASGVYSQDNMNLFWDNTAKKLGVGTLNAGNLLTLGAYNSGTFNNLKQGLLSTDNVLLASLEGGAYYGSVGVKENQWGINNRGNTWTAKAGTNGSWNNIAMSSDGKIQTAVSEGTYFVTVSDNYGETWVDKGPSGWLSGTGIDMSSDGKIQTATTAEGDIYVSTDYGNVWNLKTNNPLNAYEDVAVSSDGKIQTAVTYGGQIYISTDYGNTWTAKDSNRNWYDIAMSSDGKIQAAVTDGGQIYISTDYGNTWTAKDSNRNWFDIAMSSDGKTQTAVTSGGQIYISTDYGNTWTAKDSNRNWHGIAMTSDGKNQTAIERTGQIYVSADYGSTWTAKDSTREWYDVAMSSDGKVQAAVEYGGQIYVSYADSYVNGNIGIGTTSPTSLFSVGATSQFQVNAAGQVVTGTWNSTAIAVANGGTGATDAVTARTNLGLAIGTNVQAYNAGLADIAGLAKTDGNFIVGNGTNWVAESGATVRTSLGLGSLATLNSIDLLTNVSGILPVANGGTNASTIGGAGTIAYSSGTAYAFNNNLYWDNTSNYFRLGAGAQQFSMGVDATDSNKFKIATGNGIAGSNAFSVSTSGVTSIASLSMGTQQFSQDSGIISWIDMPVTSSAANATVESYTAQLDGNSMMTIYGKSDGAGGVNSLGVGIGDSAPTALFSVGATHGFTVNGTGQATATDGFVNKIVAGNCGDGNFTTATNGLTCIDSTNGRMYMRYGGAWHYMTQTGGFQIPNYEVAPSSELSGGALVDANDALSFEKSNFPEYLTQKMAQGELLIPYVDQYLSDGAAHGLYARFSDVKSKMFGEEQLQIAGLVLKTDASATTIAELKQSIDDQLGIVSTKFTDLSSQLTTSNSQLASHDARLTAVEALAAGLQAQIDAIKIQTNTELAAAQIDLNTQNIAYMKVLLGITNDSSAGDVTISGKLKAQILEAGKLVFVVDDTNARIIGQEKISAIKVDANNDGKDDTTGSDGKTVFVKTTAVNSSSKVFITPKIALEQGMAVTEIKSDEGFTVTVKNPVTEDVSFDWVIMEER